MADYQLIPIQDQEDLHNHWVDTFNAFFAFYNSYKTDGKKKTLLDPPYSKDIFNFAPSVVVIGCTYCSAVKTIDEKGITSKEICAKRGCPAVRFCYLDMSDEETSTIDVPLGGLIGGNGTFRAHGRIIKIVVTENNTVTAELIK